MATILSEAEAKIFLGLESSALTDAQSARLALLLPSAISLIQSHLSQTLSRTQHVEYFPATSPYDGHNVDFDSPAAYELINGKAVPARMANSSSILQLTNIPVIATSIEVREDVGAYAGQSSSPFPTSSILTRGTDYWIDFDGQDAGGTDISKTGILRRVGSWPTEPRSVKVTYHGGWSDVDLTGVAGDLRLAAGWTLQALWHKMEAWKVPSGGGLGGPKMSETLGDYSYEIGGFRSMDGGGVASVLGLSDSIPPAAVQVLEKYRCYGRLWG